MGGIHEKDGAAARLGVGSPRLQTVFLHASWAATFAVAGLIPTFRGVIPSAFKNCRTCVGLRVIPVKAAILAAASATVAGGRC
jgi:hypothetical protein